MESPPYNSDFLKMGLLLIETGNYEAALSHYDMAIDSDPIVANYGKGLVYSHLGDHTTALNCFETSLENNQFLPALVEKGRTLRKTGHPQFALESFNRALEIDKENSYMMLEKADLLIEMKDYEESLIQLENIIKLKPRFFKAFHRKGDVLCIQKKYRESCEQYIKSLELKPQYAPSWLGLGIAFQGLYQYDDAIDCYKSAINIDSSNNLANLLLGDLYHSQKDYGNALKYYRIALKNDGNCLEAYYGKGMVLTSLGDKKKGLEYLEKACAKNSYLKYAFWARGNILKDENKIKESLFSFKQAIALDPYYLPAWESIEELYSISGKLDKAIHCHNQMLSTFSTSKAIEKQTTEIKPDYKELYLKSIDFSKSFEYNK